MGFRGRVAHTNEPELCFLVASDFFWNTRFERRQGGILDRDRGAEVTPGTNISIRDTGGTMVDPVDNFFFSTTPHKRAGCLSGAG